MLSPGYCRRLFLHNIAPCRPVDTDVSNAPTVFTVRVKQGKKRELVDPPPGALKISADIYYQIFENSLYKNI